MCSVVNFYDIIKKEGSYHEKHVILLLLCFLIFPALPADAMVINLSPRDCEEAVSFGKAHRASIDKELDKRYALAPQKSMLMAEPSTASGTRWPSWQAISPNGENSNASGAA